jgi:hypothetical protein
MADDSTPWRPLCNRPWRPCNEEAHAVFLNVVTGDIMYRCYECSIPLSDCLIREPTFKRLTFEEAALREVMND